MKQEGEAETQYCQDPRPWICNTNKRNITITEVLSKEQGVQTPHWSSWARGSAMGRQAPRMSGSEKTVELVFERARQL